jgi:uncharacterized protein
MPIIQQKSKNYKSSFFGNPLLETIIPYLLIKPENIDYSRERISTFDKDVLDLDWSFSKNNSQNKFKNEQSTTKDIKDFRSSSKLIVITHGIFSNSRGLHIQKYVKIFNEKGFDVVVWHQRGCSDKTNLKQFIYHPGMTEDLDTVLNHIFENKKNYQEINLLGLSLGGNLNLKYLGQKGCLLNPKIKKAFSLSSPLDLYECSKMTTTWLGKITEKYIINNLKKVLERKKQQTPENYVFYAAEEIKKLQEFDEKFSVPMHGFKNLKNFYWENSSINFLKNIKIPTFLFSSLNDYILGPNSYPFELAKRSSSIFLLTPKFGGHSGFATLDKSELFWYEEVILEFFGNKLEN